MVIGDTTPIRFEEAAVLHHVSGAHGEAENSFDQPDNVTFLHRFSPYLPVCHAS